MSDGAPDMAELTGTQDLSGQSILELRGIRRQFGDLVVLENVNFTLRAGEIVGLVGPSGSGKSSLLHIAGLLEAPSAGDVIIDGRPTAKLNDTDRTLIRRDTVGFVYQAHHLLPEFDAIGNVALPQLIAGKGEMTAYKEAERLLTALGLGTRLSHQPGQLSGGEQQRTALGRALANAPKVLLADEPTGNLDTETSASVFDELIRLVRGEGLAALIATHDMKIAARMDRIVTIRNKTLAADLPGQ